jgi:hypothetical protein
MKDPEVDAIKHDMKALLNALGLQRVSNHNPCPFCSDKDGLSLSVLRDSGHAYFKCHKCDTKGNIFEALMKLEGKTFIQVKQALLGSGGNYKVKPTFRPQTHSNLGSNEKPTPVIDMARAEPFIKMANEFLLDNMQYVQEYRRGLSREIVEKYRIGFIFNQSVRLYDTGRPYHFNATWVIPVTNEEGLLCGVKLHHQIKPLTPSGMEHPAKCSWAPFGMEPKEDRATNIKPAHAYYTLFPHPSEFDKFDENFSLDPVWWIRQIKPDTEIYERWHSLLRMEQNSIAYALGIHVDKLELQHIEQSFQNSYAQLGKDIRKEVLRQNGKFIPTEEKPDQVILPDPDEFIFICPGELKALAIRSEGLQATAITGGEAWIPSATQLSHFRGKSVVIVRDDDLTTVHPTSKRLVNSGKSWAARMTDALINARVKQVFVMDCGQIKKPKTKEELANGQEEELKL